MARRVIEFFWWTMNTYKSFSHLTATALATKEAQYIAYLNSVSATFPGMWSKFHHQYQHITGWWSVHSPATLWVSETCSCKSDDTTAKLLIASAQLDIVISEHSIVYGQKVQEQDTALVLIRGPSCPSYDLTLSLNIEQGSPPDEALSSTPSKNPKRAGTPNCSQDPPPLTQKRKEATILLASRAVFFYFHINGCMSMTSYFYNRPTGCWSHWCPQAPRWWHLP